MSGQIVELAPATRVASRKLGPVAGISPPSPSARAACADEDVREDVRQVRHARHHAVVQRRVDRGRLRADPDERAVQALVERSLGRGPRGEIPRRAVEEVGAGVLDARGLGARERVAADEARVIASADDGALGRADVGDRAVRRRAGQRLVDRAAERRRRARRRTRARRRQRPRRAADAECSIAPRASAASPTRAIGVEADDLRVQARARRQPDRAADQPDADDGDPHACVNTLPAIAAARSTFAAYSANSSARSACGPSQIASSGLGCTSTMIPSAPAAAAA